MRVEYGPKTTDVAVIDGQKGLLAAILCLWPQTKIQRCLVHIERLARIKLTRPPKTRAGKELLMLVRGLFGVRTRTAQTMATRLSPLGTAACWLSQGA